MFEAQIQGLRGLLHRVGENIPHVDVHLFDGRPGVELTIGERRWGFDASQAARYVSDNARSLFGRITRLPVTNAPACAPTRNANLNQCFLPTPENLPRILAQVTSNDPTQRHTGEGAFRTVLRTHPRETALAVNAHREHLHNPAQMSQLDHAVVTSAQHVAQSGSTPAERVNGRSSVATFAACTHHTPTRAVLVRTISGAPSHSTTTGRAVAAQMIPTTPPYVVLSRSEIGHCPSLFRVSIADRNSDVHHARSLMRHEDPMMVGEAPLPGERIPLLGLLPIETHPSGSLPLGETPASSGATRISVPTIPIIGADGRTYYVAVRSGGNSSETTLFRSLEGLHAGNPASTLSSTAPREGVAASQPVYIPPANNRDFSLPVGIDMTPPRERVRVENTFSPFAETSYAITTPPRDQIAGHPLRVASHTPHMPSLFGGPAANDIAPLFVPPSQAGFTVPGNPSVVSSRAAIGSLLGGANPPVFARGGRGGGQGQRDSRGGRDQQGRDGHQENPRDQYPEQARNEAAA